MGSSVQEMKLMFLCDFLLIQSMFTEHILLPGIVDQQCHVTVLVTRLMERLVHLHESFCKVSRLCCL